MGKQDERRIAAAKRALVGLAGESDLPPEIARVFSRGLIKDWVDGSIAWAPEWSKLCLDQALRLVQAARILDELHEADAALPAWRRAGELLEWLSRANDDLRTEVPLALLAGAAFQLGQLPAMSFALLQRVEVKQWESPVHAAFLAGDLAGVLDLVVAFWAERIEHTGTTGSARLLEGRESTESFVVHELVRCLGLIAGALRDDRPERVALGLKKLDAINAYAQSTAGTATALLIDLESAVAQRYARRSIYVGLAPLIQPGNSPRQAALDRFARGLVADGKALMWPSQERGVARLATGESFAICTPTGSGKTLVALLAVLVETLAPPPSRTSPFRQAAQPPGGLALYLVPSRALAMEVERDARARLGPCGVIVSSLYGEADWGGGDLDLLAPAPRMLVTTVEKAEALWRLAGREMESRLRLLIVDEAHQVVLRGVSREQQLHLVSGEDRALRLESFVSRLLSRRGNIKRVAVSAVAGDAEPLLAKWVGGVGSQPVSPPGRSVRQVVGRLELVKEKHRVRIDRYNGVEPSGSATTRFIALNIPAVPSGSPQSLTENAYTTADAMSIWAGTYLAIRKRRVLIAVGSKLSATLSRALVALNSRAWKAAHSGSHPWFETPMGEKGELYRAAVASLDSYMGPGSQDAQLLRRGVAAHHGQLPDVPRRLVTALIQQGVVRIVIATSTLSEGVNLPFDIVVMPVAGRRRSREVGRRREWYIEPYSAEEFANLSGRAGRPGMGRSMEGLTVVAMPTGRQRIELEAAYSTVLSHLDGPIDAEQAAASPLGRLLAWVEELAEEAGISADALPGWLEEVSPRNLEGPILNAIDALDQVILSAIAEVEAMADRELTTVELETCLQALWSASFASIAAVSEDQTGVQIRRRGHGVVREYNERRERKRLYMLGLPPARGKKFFDTAARLEAYMRGGDAFEAMDEVERASWLTGLVDLLRLDPALGFKDPGESKRTMEIQENWKDHLSWWLGLQSTFPTGEELRGVLRFVMEQFDFRTGVAVGAVLADVWERSGVESDATDLLVWHEVTGLPWVCYWVRDLLKYGTVSPVRAYLLARQRVFTRADAKTYEDQFIDWLDREGHTLPDETLRPVRIREWEQSVFSKDMEATILDQEHVAVELDEQFRGYSESLMAWPVVGPTETVWFEPGGYRIGSSTRVDAAAEPLWRKRIFFNITPTEGTVRWRKF